MKLKRVYKGVKHYSLRFDFKNNRRTEISFAAGKDKWNSDKVFCKDIFGDGIKQYGIYLGRFALVYVTGMVEKPKGKVVVPYVSK
jgi:hypothetical protein